MKGILLVSMSWGMWKKAHSTFLLVCIWKRVDNQFLRVCYAALQHITGRDATFNTFGISLFFMYKKIRMNNPLKWPCFCVFTSPPKALNRLRSIKGHSVSSFRGRCAKTKHNPEPELNFKHFPDRNLLVWWLEPEKCSTCTVTTSLPGDDTIMY